MPRTRKIIVYIATSADGFIARPDGPVDWLDRPRPKGGYGMGAFYKTIDTILRGRKTYEVALDFQRKGVPGSAFDPRVKNHVFTRSLPASAAAAGVEFVNEPIKKFASRLWAESGRPKKQWPEKRKDIWIMGGAGLIASFLDAGEMDEFDTHVIPTFIGGRHSVDRAVASDGAVEADLLYEVSGRRGSAAVWSLGSGSVN